MGERTDARGPVGSRVAGAEEDAAPRLGGSAEPPSARPRRMLDGADHSCVLVRLPAGLGIATDHDFRASLADANLSRETPLSAICSVPAVTVNEHTDAPAALLEMVERGIHHLVVTTDTGNPVGVVRVVDLASAEVRDPLLVRRSVTRARSLDDLREAASIVPQTVLEMDEIGTPALRVSGILSTVRDLIVQRVVELTPTVVPTSRVSWLVLGSLARREALPHSDVDTALAWPALLDARAPQLRADAELVLTGLERCGLSRCPDGANATEPLFSRSVEDWEECHAPLDPPSGVGERPAARLDRGRQPPRDPRGPRQCAHAVDAELDPRADIPQRAADLHPRRQAATRASSATSRWPTPVPIEDSSTSSAAASGRWCCSAGGWPSPWATRVARPSTGSGAVPSQDSSRRARPRTSSAHSSRFTSFASTRRSPP